MSHMRRRPSFRALKRMNIFRAKPPVSGMIMVPRLSRIRIRRRRKLRGERRLIWVGRSQRMSYLTCARINSSNMLLPSLSAPFYHVVASYDVGIFARTRCCELSVIV